MNKKKKVTVSKKEKKEVVLDASTEDATNAASENQEDAANASSATGNSADENIANHVEESENIENLISKTNYAKLENILLEKISHRDEISERLKEARSEGDLSENAEYDIARDDQGTLEGEINSIEAALRSAKVVAKRKSSAFIGNTITLKANNKVSKNDKFLLISPLEKYYIDFEGDVKVVPADSPKGELIINKKVGDVIDFNDKSWVIKSID